MISHVGPSLWSAAAAARLASVPDKAGAIITNAE